MSHYIRTLTNTHTHHSDLLGWALRKMLGCIPETRPPEDPSTEAYPTDRTESPLAASICREDKREQNLSEVSARFYGTTQIWSFALMELSRRAKVPACSEAHCLTGDSSDMRGLRVVGITERTHETGTPVGHISVEGDANFEQ